MKNILRTSFSLAFAIGVLAGPARADDHHSYPLSASYREECGSCHVAYPPALMSAASWQAVMNGLERHFGSDASIEPAKAREIRQFLAANSAQRAKYESYDANGRPALRITEGAWFQRKHRDGHDGITAAVWRLPSVKSPANCGACHRQAEQGDFSESGIRIPRS
jgi:nitrate/TMAO reductase-like tetraheme cytochrome c subunit